jgi:ribosomal protein L9
MYITKNRSAFRSQLLENNYVFMSVKEYQILKALSKNSFNVRAFLICGVGCLKC